MNDQRLGGGVSRQPLLVRRVRLDPLLDEALAHPLTSIIAPAGFGKSTALGQWAANHQVIWHGLTAADPSLPALAKAVVNGLRLHVPRLSADVTLAVDGQRGPDANADEKTRANALAAIVCGELHERLSDDVVLVLDDLHHLEKDQGAASFVGGLVRHAPPRFRIITASRTRLPFPVGRLRVEGNLHEISSADLAFTIDEVEMMLEQAGVQAKVDPRLLTEQTAGWPAALRLATERAAASPAGTPFDANALPTALEALHDYLAEEVLAAESADTVQLLAALALVPWVSPALIARFPIATNAGLLDRLMHQRIFLTPASQAPGAIEVLPLMRDFLQQRQPLDTATRAAVLTLAAEHYVESSAYVDALNCLTQSGDSEALANMLNQNSHALIGSGLAEELLVAAQSIPAEFRSDDIVVLEAQARQVLGDWEGSLRTYQRVVPKTGPIRADAAWRMGLLHHMRGDVNSAVEIYERGELDGTRTSDEAMLLAWMAGAYWLRGNRDQCRTYADRSLQLASEADDAAPLAAAHTVLAMVAALDGDRTANDAHYLRALDHAERAHDVLQTIRIRSNRGSRNMEEGNYATALEELDIALRLADSTGFATWRALALSNRGQVLYHLGRLDEAVAALEESSAVFRRSGAKLEAYPLGHLGDVYRVRGDTALARAAYEGAIQLSEENEDLQGLVPSLAGLARVLEEGDPEAAAVAAARAVDNSAVLGHGLALLASGWVSLAAGDVTQARLHAVESASLCRSRRDRSGLAEALVLEAATLPAANTVEAATLLTEARRVFEELGEPVGVARVDVALARHGTAGDASVRQALRSVDDLMRLGARGVARSARRQLEGLIAERLPQVHIRSLGGFELTRHGSIVAASEWQSRRARDLLKMLVTARGRPVHREILAGRLWPDVEISKSTNRLSVALSTIRAIFDPDKTHDTHHYLIAGRETVALNLETVDLDVERFLRLVESGTSQRDAGNTDEAHVDFMAAEELYVGDFLEDHPFDDWAVGLREECRVGYLQLAEELATAAQRRSDYDAASRFYLRLLERDPFHEPAHLGLVSATIAAGRYGDARRLYGHYLSRMDELGIEPASFPEDARPST